MAAFTTTPSHPKQLHSIPLCKFLSDLHSFKFHSSFHLLTFLPSKHSLQPSFSPLVVKAHVSHILPRSSSTDQKLSNNNNHATNRRTGSGFSHFGTEGERVERKSVRKKGSSVVGGNLKRIATKRGEIGNRFSSKRSKDENLVRELAGTIGDMVVNEEENKKAKKGVDEQVGVKMEKGAKKIRVDDPGVMLRVGLDMCSKKGDVMGALKLYDSAQREGIKMGQYHYAVLLYLCSSAATGIVRPAKSGSGSRRLSTAESTSEASTVNSGCLVEIGETSKGNFHDDELSPRPNNVLLVGSSNHLINSDRTELNSRELPTEAEENNSDSTVNGKEKLVQVFNGAMKLNPQVTDGTIHLSSDYDSKNAKNGDNTEKYEIRVSEEFKKFALQRGFEIYEKMCFEKVPMNEASLTSVARMALAMGDGDMAFEMVKQMKALGINPRLRSYGPALSVYCNSGDTEKAFAVEKHMLENGVYPEEPELEALLRVSIEAGTSDKVYYLLHKLRTSVRKVSLSTADLLEKWFRSKIASKVGKRKWDKKLIREAIENRGGGWHGQGWLGKGKWILSRTSVGSDGVCKCCGEKLAIIDLDPKETEKFAESVASIAAKREKNSSFQKFQKWLDYYGPFEAVVDGANVGLFTQRKFRPSKVNAIVNGIRQLLPSKKWPLIVLHNRRITGNNMDKPVNKALIEKWRNADALYGTPTGSNDDWYWLYAAIKFKCLIVTNDEMRDHLFQLLGNDFFPKWKERHHVRFSFSETGPVFHMPPPCSVVIQESEKGHWHIPIVSEQDNEGERTWLCVTRANSPEATLVSPTMHKDPQFPLHKEGCASSNTQTKRQAKITPMSRSNSRQPHQEICRNLKNILSTPVSSSYPTILPDIEAAEKLGCCVIDFHI